MDVNESAKRLVTRLTSKLGFEIKRSAPRSLELRSTVGQSYALLRRLGANPRTVIDVGVAWGTEELYSKFADAYFLLIEPLESFEPGMQSVLRRYRGSHVVAAAGAEAGDATFNVHDFAEGSSLYQETMGSQADGRQVTVPMVTIDDLVRERQLEGPFLIKIDVQGAELDVLEGSQHTLKEAETVVLEVSLFEFMKGAPQLHDVISRMHEYGLVAWDIIPGWNRPLDGALGQVDIVFVKEDGPFRVDHRYDSLEPRTGTDAA